MTVLNDLKKITAISIRKNPKLYFKYTYVMFIKFFRTINGGRSSFYNFRLVNRVGGYFSHSPACLGKEEKMCNTFLPELLDTSNSTLIKKQTAKENLENVKSDILNKFNSHITIRLNHFFARLHGKLFRNTFWVFISTMMLIYSLVILIKSKFRNTTAFIISICFLMNITFAILICLVETVLVRYSITTAWAYYLGIALFPALLIKETGTIHSKLSGT